MTDSGGARSVLVLGAHHTSGASMQRHANLVRNAWSDLGWAVTVWSGTEGLSQRWRHPSARKWTAYLEKFVFGTRRLRALARQADLVHICDHSDAPWALLINRRPLIITVHDLFAVRASLGEVGGFATSRSGRYYQKLVLMGLRRATLLVADSDATGQDTKRLVGREARTIHLPIPLGLVAADNSGGHLESQRFVPDGPFLLIVSGTGWRKARDRSVSAWLALRETSAFSQHRLAVVGPALTARERAFLGEAVAHVDSLTHLSDQDLGVLYRNCSALLLLSRDEGFGWPVIEAHSFARPSLCSDIAVLRETAGAGAVYVNPDSHVDWPSVARTLAAPELGHMALVNASRFSMQAYLAGLADAADSASLTTPEAR